MNICRNLVLPMQVLSTMHILMVQLTLIVVDHMLTPARYPEVVMEIITTLHLTTNNIWTMIKPSSHALGLTGRFLEM